MNKTRVMGFVLCLGMLLIPMDSNAFIFGLIKDIINTGHSVAQQVADVLNMSYAVKEYGEEQIKTNDYRIRAETILYKNMAWFTEEEFERLTEMKNNIQKDIDAANKSDWNFLSSLLEVKADPDAALSRADKAEINNYINDALSRIRILKFEIMSYCTYVQCCAQSERIRLKRIKYGTYRMNAVQDLEKLYQK